MVIVDLIKKYYQKRIFRTFLFALIGAIGGYAYYYFIGCYSGTCPITSNPFISSIYGAVIGLILTPSQKKNKEQ